MWQEVSLRQQSKGYTHLLVDLRLNIYSREALLALLYRTLAAPVEAEGIPPAPSADETLRRIEHVQVRATEALKQQSEYRAVLHIAEEKLSEARSRSQRASIDLQIFKVDNPLPVKRGLLTPRLTQEQKQVKQRLEQLQALASGTSESLVAREAELQTIKKKYEDVQRLRQDLHAQRMGLIGQLHPQLCKAVIFALMSMKPADAEELLTASRGIVRGDPLIGSLHVLTALFSAESRSQGAQSARDTLGSLRALFEQHPGPYERVLLAFIALVASGGELRPSLIELGIHQHDEFSTPGLYRLYVLTRVLGRLSFNQEQLLCDFEFARVLCLIEAFCGGSTAQVDQRAQIPGWPTQCRELNMVVDWLVVPDDPAEAMEQRREFDQRARERMKPPPLFDLTLIGNLLLAEGRQAEIPAAVGLDLAAIPAPRQRGGKYPALLGFCEKLPAPVWPTETIALWHSLMALHLLCAARSLPLGGAYEQWLEESYGWPKSAFYWRAIAWLKDDPSLLRNVKDSGWLTI